LTVGATGAPIGLQLLGLATASTQGSLVLNSGSTLDLGNNALTLNFGSPANDPKTTLLPKLIAGRNNGTWTGPGITSSSAAANNVLYAVGYADGNVDTLTSAGPNQFTMEFTLAADANLDGSVDFPDLVSLAQNFGFTGRDWAQGNFNYDSTGTVAFSDLVILAQEFGDSTTIASAGGPVSVSPAWQSLQATAVVPEPASLAIAAIGAVGLLARRRRGPTRD
jgi:PEP-CTERM motif